jgi:hypothetical protein
LRQSDSRRFLVRKVLRAGWTAKKLFSDMVSLKGMGSTFRDCTALIALPSGLLDGCINLTSLTLTFSGCTSLAVLPGDLLKNNILLSGAGSTFYGCTSLVNIPPTLFASCSLITSFGATFQNTGVEEIPENLFSGNPLVTSTARLSGAVKTCAQCQPVFLPPA